MPNLYRVLYDNGHWSELYAYDTDDAKKRAEKAIFFNAAIVSIYPVDQLT